MVFSHVFLPPNYVERAVDPPVFLFQICLQTPASALFCFFTPTELQATGSSALSVAFLTGSHVLEPSTLRVPHVSRQTMPVSQPSFVAVRLIALVALVKKAVTNKPDIRRECSLDCPRRALELRAQERLKAIGLMDGLLDCFLIFFLMAHSPDGLGPELMLARMMLRALNRPQALGLSGIGVDLDLGLRLIIEAKFGMPIDELFRGFDLPNDNGMWTHEQVS